MKKLILIFVAVFGMTMLCSAPVMAAWEGEDPICQMNVEDELKELAGCNQTEDVQSKIPGAVTAVFSVAGIIAVGVIIFGGVRYSVSMGDAGKIKRAKDTILYAVIGLLVTLSAFAIVAFVLENIG